MKVSDSIVLPDALEAARTSGDLVVFAGAGVSMGPPARLPNFRKLAQQIAGAVVTWDDQYETAIDRYLGRAADAQVNVQAIARRLLQNDRPHNPIHEHLLGIFGEPSRVRLITTNFDTHFSSAAKRVFPSAEISQYVGPALPPGRDFAGIAQLHGSLARSGDRLVLTDADFAGAYMAEGWASRFLWQVFERRTVLFVGYSVSDPLMQYLLRALPSSGRWYALWHEDEAPPAGSHAIVPINFRTAADGSRFGDLDAGMRRWHWYSTAPASNHDQELRRIIGAGVPKSPVDEDYLRARLESAPGRIVFWEKAQDPQWMRWAADEGYLEPLLSRGHGETPPDARWARWALSNFCRDESAPLLRFLRERTLDLNEVFVRELFAFLLVGSELPPQPVLRQLVAVLCNQVLTGRVQHIEYLFSKLIGGGHIAETMMLFRMSTRVRLQSSEYRSAASDTSEEQGPARLHRLSSTLECLAAPRDLLEVLETHGNFLLATCGESLLDLGVGRILESYELLDAARGAGETIDHLNVGRVSIAPSAQDSYPTAEDVMVTLVRVVLDHSASGDSSLVERFAGTYLRSPVTLLRRLALYALSLASTLPADAILARAMELGWARDYWIRPEFYRVMRTHFPRASEPARRQLVERLRSPEAWLGMEAADSERRRFDTAHMLARVSPRSPSARGFKREEKGLHPRWREQDVDGFWTRSWFSWAGADSSPISAADLLALPAPTALREIHRLLRTRAGRFESHSLFGAVQQAVQGSDLWARGLAALLLTSRARTRYDLQESILWGLRSVDVSQVDRLAWIRLFEGMNLRRPSLLRAVASVVKRWADGLTGSGTPEELSALDAMADLIFARAKKAEPGMADRGWTERAINHPAGDAAGVWLRTANARDMVDGRFVLSVDQVEKDRWLRVLKDETAAGSHARPILGMALDRLAAADYPWAEREIFPHFNPDTDITRAAQLWDGRLAQKQWALITLEGVRPYLSSLFRRSASLLPGRESDLGDWVAFLVAAHQRERFTLQLLQDFIRNAGASTREAFADAVPKHLSRLSAEDRRRVWRDLLAPYWNARTTNVPAALSSKEVGLMAGWLLALVDDAADALALLEMSGSTCDGGGHLLWRLDREHDWVRGHPDVAVGLVRFLASRGEVDYLHAERALSIIAAAVEAGASGDGAIETVELIVPVSPEAAFETLTRLRSMEA